MGVLVETTVAGIEALAKLRQVKGIMENQEIVAGDV